MDAVRLLLRSSADALLTTTPTGQTTEPLVGAAGCGLVEVVRRLIRQVGIESCGGKSGGLDALCLAAAKQHLDTMAAPTVAGVGGTDKGPPGQRTPRSCLASSLGPGMPTSRRRTLTAERPWPIAFTAAPLVLPGLQVCSSTPERRRR